MFQTMKPGDNDYPDWNGRRGMTEGKWLLVALAAAFVVFVLFVLCYTWGWWGLFAFIIPALLLLHYGRKIFLAMVKEDEWDVI